MIISHAIAIVIAYILDTLIGDPKTWPHPVKAFGKLIGFLDVKLNKHQKKQGVYMIVIVILIVASISITIVYYAYSIHLYLGIIVEGALISTTIAQKALKDAAWDVYRPLSENNIALAREKVAYIVGRDTETLDASEISRATIETVAENTTDAITAPLFWAAIGGAPFALIYRAINTCDSMVGYKNEEYQNFGWASAKLDDIVNWLPARITGNLMLVCRQPMFQLKTSRFLLLVNESKHHSSPNSAWTEAAVALLLGIQLGGENYYQGKKSIAPRIGEKYREIEPNDILRTIRLMYMTVLLFLCVYGIGVGGYVMANTWS